MGFTGQAWNDVSCKPVMKYHTIHFLRIVTAARIVGYLWHTLGLTKANWTGRSPVVQKNLCTAVYIYDAHMAQSRHGFSFSLNVSAVILCSNHLAVYVSISCQRYI